MTWLTPGRGVHALRKPTSRRRAGWVICAAVLALALATPAVLIGHTIQGHLRALHPRRTTVSRAAAADLGELQDVAFVTSDGLTIRGWVHPSKNHAAVILTHGGGGTRQQVIPEATMLAHHGYGVLLFDWRAHGESDGDKCTWGSLEQRDLTAAIDFLANRPDVDPERIGAIGFSFGGGVVVTVAAKDRRLKAVVTEGTTPTLVERLALDSGRFRALTAPPSIWAVGREIDLDSVRPIDHVCAIHPRPVLIISGDDQSDQPNALARELFDAACEPKEYWQVVGAAHGKYGSVAPIELERRLLQVFDGALLDRHRGG
ncbi:MAG: alpha/beta hydrolase [Polyangiales bacterium]